ncbi:hypothetical protein AKJ08_1214 [Vulgatibacter incomptus]|uniref:Silver efflux pump n=2 Tax=Vulgatibacter incomptus TaxID=1391653 RepID=A0A0K1PBF6_9BACT|nr:hypothetical protein AKJ08_1214 [Vulgatibacter incomptus]
MGPLKGAAIAGALAVMFAGGAAYAEGKTDKSASKSVKCNGTNDCKGKGNCKSAQHDCKGQNNCKGQSFTMEQDAKACADKGGTVAK